MAVAFDRRTLIALCRGFVPARLGARTPSPSRRRGNVPRNVVRFITRVRVQPGRVLCFPLPAMFSICTNLPSARTPHSCLPVGRGNQITVVYCGKRRRPRGVLPMIMMSLLLGLILRYCYSAYINALHIRIPFSVSIQISISLDVYIYGYTYISVRKDGGRCRDTTGVQRCCRFLRSE